MNFATVIASVFLYLNLALALPVGKRFYQPTSPVFSLIAHHKGKEFQYHLVKFNGEDLELGVDEPAFFGRIKGNEGYVLNIPFGNSSNGTFSIPDNSTNSTNTSYPLNTNVYVDKTGKLTTSPNNTSSEGFGISHSLLTYHNSSKFLACPVLASNSTNSTGWNSTHHNSTVHHRGRTLHANSTALNKTHGYDIYFKGNKTVACPHNLTGYDVSLLVQVAAAINYSPETNTDSFKKKRSLEAPSKPTRSFWFL